MAKTTDVPKFGPLSGIKVLSTGSVVASPYSSMLFAEGGATVIHAESANAPDTCRSIKYAWNQEHRNEIGLAINIPTPEGREIFLKLIKWADIWFESSKGGTYAKWGLSDEVLHEVNPKLVIVHVCGFGQEGDPDYVNRASYDAVGQAFGGYIFINGMPDPNPPMRANPYTCDYVTALNGAFAAMAAYHNAQKTGKGEVIDIAQFEMMMKIQLHYPMTYFQEGRVIGRNGNSDPSFGGYSVFRCKDDNYVFIGVVGGGPIKKAKKLLGLEGDPDFPEGMQLAVRSNPSGAKLDAAIEKFCAQFDAADVERQFLENGLPCSMVLNVAMAENNPHYKAREVFTEWEDPQYGKVKGVNILPKYTKTPGKIWRGAPLYGQDNSDVLKEFGYTQEEVDDLYEKGVLKAGKGCH